MKNKLKNLTDADKEKFCKNCFECKCKWRSPCAIEDPELAEAEVIIEEETRWFAGCNEINSAEEFTLNGHTDKGVVERSCQIMRKNYKDCQGCEKQPIKATIRYEITKEG